ncbi:hypothetical protein [Streptosporangium sp. NPDC002721]|uniref:hypothetical protein n=1 Tax=Streptosporangium sp. NPDC002721 TaxID=3366188 RepID=UPI003692F30B
MDEPSLMPFYTPADPVGMASGGRSGTLAALTECHRRSPVRRRCLGGAVSGDWTVTLKKVVGIKDYSSTKLELIGQHEVVSPQTGVTAHELQRNPPAVLRWLLKAFF